MPNNPLRTRFEILVDAAIHEAKAASDIDHPGLTGTIREILVERMLRPVITPEIKIGSGKMVDFHGNKSGETDVILYSPEIMPPSLYDQRTGLFPVESVLYAIEVKSKLTRDELMKSFNNGNKLYNLKHLQTEYWNGDEKRNANKCNICF